MNISAHIVKKYITFSLLLLISVAFRGQDFRFAVVTDIHLNRNNPLPEEDLINTVNDINTNKDIRFVLVTGDISESGDYQSLRKAKDILDRLNVKYYAISGNHETKWSESGATDFGHIFGSERFDFEYGGIRFFGFNTGPVIRMMDGHIAPQDISWLKQELAAMPSGQPVILVTHYPLLDSDVDNWCDLTNAVRSYNIKSFIGGHYHSNRLFSYDGIPAFICRSNLRDKQDNTGGYSIFNVTSDSLIVYERKIKQEPVRWGAYSLKKVYYRADNKTCSGYDLSVNNEYPQVKEVWTTSNGSAFYTSPVISGDKVYAGDDSGVFSCYFVKDGTRDWSFTSENRIVGTAAVYKDIVIFGSADKNIYCLDTKKGKLRWKYNADKAVLGSASIDNGIAYIGASDNTFRAIDIKTGKLVWEFPEVKGYIETRPLIYKDKIFFGAWDETMYALDKHTGRLLWKWAEGRKGILYSPAAVWPVAAHDRVFFTAPDRVMTAVDANTGKTIWKMSDWKVRETIGLSEDKERLYSKTMQDSVVCYSATSGYPQQIWATNVGYGYDHAPSMPVEKDGVVFGSTKNGIIFAIEGKTGKLLWKHKVGNSIINTVYPLNGKECIYTSGGGLVGLLRYEK
ncbi:MAG: PQQ-binding-like beta-propeller repeat protein [Prevotella sp.]|jgi:outer membrane protein assembly factor BamB/predicted phosphodiesterase|nr:PQQ-binding-like beta-propeller repeat protein [Prevotella sp.]